MTPVPLHPRPRNRLRPCRPPAPAGLSRGLVLVAVLGVLALAVVFLLPVLVPEPGPATAAAPTMTAADAASGDAPTAADTETIPDTEGGGETPWTEARRQDARRGAQDTLARARELERELVDRGAERWDEARMTRAFGLLQQGDLAYREQDFREAERFYVLGYEQLDEVKRQAEAEMASAIATADSALAAGDAERAAPALDRLRTLDSDNDALTGLQARFEAWPEVRNAVDSAEDLAAQRDFAGAVARLEAALALDPAAAHVETLLQAQRAALAEQRFRAAMTAGFRALDAADFAAARAAFGRAQTMRPGNAEARDALAQVEVLAAQDRLARLRREALAAEAREDWAAAADAYEAMLGVDPGLREARLGADRSRDLETTTTLASRWLEKPALLTTDDAYENARAVLARWSNYPLEAPALRALQARLDRTLEVIRLPVPVDLVSDAATQVILLRQGSLGAFERRSLELLPGSYVLRGSRRGYRDVRVPFDVTPGAKDLSVEVVCTERL